jgi:alcohol dehydrogenase, propanol-preferring
MRAMVLEKIKKPLQLKELPIPEPGKGQLLIKVTACGICRTDLHVIDGELARPKLPLIPGHQIIGNVVKVHENKDKVRIGKRVGISWLGGCCDHCSYCLAGRENLCSSAIYTGYQINGGFAEFCVADSRFCLPIPDVYKDIEAAPLLCAGLIGYRCLKMAGDGKKLGLYGFGSAAHIIIQIARYQGKEVFVFTRKNDNKAKDFALSLGASWVGSSEDLPPKLLDAAIIFAPVGSLVPAALRAVDKGGVVVCGGIHMSDIPSFAYTLLWEERSIRSVANLTRQDSKEFLMLAPKIPVKTKVNLYPLEDTNQALEDLRQGRFSGTGVIVF